jgi:NADH-quinone oxidoreductase subunit J
MTLTNVILAIMCIASLAGGAIVLFASNPTRSLLGLFLASLSVGVIYLLLGGAFVAMAQIIVYAGAVLMLFLFVVRYFVRKLPGSKIQWQLPAGILAVLILFLQILIPVVNIFSKGPFDDNYVPPDTALLGKTIFEQYVYPFELISVLLLVAIVGAIYMARGEMQEPEGGNIE